MAANPQGKRQKRAEAQEASQMFDVFLLRKFFHGTNFVGIRADSISTNCVTQDLRLMRGKMRFLCIN